MALMPGVLTYENTRALKSRVPCSLGGRVCPHPVRIKLTRDRREHSMHEISYNSPRRRILIWSLPLLLRCAV